MKRKVLFLCTANSCRSQMAEGLVRHLLPKLCEPYSAGTEPRPLDPRAVQVMKEIGIDISEQKSKHLSAVSSIDFDLVITLCDEASQSCPAFTGKTKKVVHMGFDDPARVKGSDEEILSEFRRIRDQIRDKLIPFLSSAFSA